MGYLEDRVTDDRRLINVVVARDAEDHLGGQAKLVAELVDPGGRGVVLVFAAFAGYVSADEDCVELPSPLEERA